ncbi:DMT family transporter [uncultured Thiothrix sp.]|uniref:DMT family transporter n=1 Tax=uncultured Thiothrix sp. TaxID=223185 RepID=UPI002624013D|nr:DMT family transporter [uncultured Thiothrix sp.]HMT93231.1 DMT family transporter [Thiolinea sp.]
MPNTRQALDGKAMGIMVLLCMLWGVQQSHLKAVVDEISLMLLIALRSGLSALLVAGLMHYRQERMNLAQNWKPGLVVGLLFAVEFVFVAEGLRYTAASHMIVLVYTAPIFVALGMHWLFPAERLAAVQWVGVLLAFVGIGVTFLGHEQPSTGSNMLWGDFLGLLSGLAWGLTTLVVRASSLANAPATETLQYQLVATFILLLIVALVTGQAEFNPTPVVWASLAFQGILVSFASFLIWFALLRRYMAAQLGIFSFLTPLFGVLFGVVLLNESLELHFIIGAVMVLLGLVVVSGYGWFVGWRGK